MKDKIRNLPGVARSILVILGAMVIHLFGRLDLYLINVFAVFVDESNSIGILLTFLSISHLGILIIAKLCGRRPALITAAVTGTFYIICGLSGNSGMLEYLLVMMVTAIIASENDMIRSERKICTHSILYNIHESAIIASLAIILCILNKLIASPFDPDFQTPIVVGGVLLYYGVVILCNMALFFLSFSPLFQRKRKDSKLLDQNFRKQSINSRVIFLINIICLFLLFCFILFSLNVIRTLNKNQKDNLRYTYQDILADRLSENEALLMNGDDEELSAFADELTQMVSAFYVDYPLTIELVVTDGSETINYGTFQITDDTASDHLSATWNPHDSIAFNMSNYTEVGSSGRILIHFSDSTAVQIEELDIFRIYACCFIVCMIFINLIAQAIIRKKLILPINRMTTIADDYAIHSNEDISRFLTALKELNIQSGDEIESLSTSMAATMQSMADYVQQVQETSAKLSSIQHNVIITMADIIESRDENTGGHVRRTAIYVKIIANHLVARGIYTDILTPEYIEHMVVSAPLHDMGKIHVPDSVLNKNGRLNDEEYAIMKKHTLEGRELLSHASKQLGSFDYLEIAMQMALSHHEYWNGKGYPEGIAGEEIPLCARIMAVADVFDALVSKRCYKEGMPVEQACAIIREESGSHFDPAVVDAFFDAIDEIKDALSEQEE